MTPSLKSLKLFFVVLAFSCFSCDYDAPYVPQEGTRLEQVLFVHDVVGQEIMDAVFSYVKDNVKGLDLEPYKTLLNDYLPTLLENRIRFVVIEYKTVDPFGKETIASGTFAYPVGNKSRGVVEVSPIAHNDRFHFLSASVIKQAQYSSPSEMDSSDLMPYLFTLPSILNYICLFPDCIGSGYGESANYLRTWLHPTSDGQCFYYFRQAVSEYLWENEQIKLPKQTNLMGYSFGGSVVFSVADYYNYCTDIKVEHIFAGGGLYDMETAMEDFKTWETMDYCSIPAVIISFDKYFNLNLDYNKIFIGGMENSVNTPNAEDGGDGYAYWYDNTHSTEEIHDRWGGNFRGYIHPDFFLPGLQGEFSKLKEVAFETSIVHNCTLDKETKIQIFHSTEDNIVPFECAEVLYDRLLKDGYDVKFFKLTGNHYMGAAYYLIPTLLELYAINYNKLQ